LCLKSGAAVTNLRNGTLTDTMINAEIAEPAEIDLSAASARPAFDVVRICRKVTRRPAFAHMLLESFGPSTSLIAALSNVEDGDAGSGR
jgi:hypothetical protein